MDIFERLKQDHDEHRVLLKKLSETSGASDERKALFEEFKVEVKAHAAAEEESLYAEMLKRPDLRHEGQHSVSEHKEIEDYLEELTETDMSSPGWKATFDKMRHRYEHHIEEEEEEIFVEANSELNSSCAQYLEKVFDKRKPKELERAEAE
jgi:DNA-binding transcriptional MerR regulator